MITAKEVDLLKAHEQFEKMCEFMQQAVEQGQRMDQVERGLFPQAMEMCLHLLSAFVDAHGDGDEGAEIEAEDRSLRRLKEPHDKRYLSIFGELIIPRVVYGTRERQAIEWVPLDAVLGLPAGENSYVLEDWLERLCVKEAYGEAVSDLRAWLGTTVSVRTAEGSNRHLATYSEGYRLSQGLPSPAEDEDILVVSADGKGVPMRRPLEQRLREARAAAGASLIKTPPATAPEGSGSPRRTQKKQMAYVGAVYSIAPFVRTAEDVIDEVRRRQRSPARPSPIGKHLWAQMTRLEEGAVWPAVPRLFVDMAVERHQRDPERRKTLVCLMDGERQFWDLQQEWFGRGVGILDLFHALKRLWAVAHCVHAEKSPAASEFVTHHLRMLLEGKVGYVIRNFRRLIKQHGLRGTKQKTVQSAITYYQNNRAHMRYSIFTSLALVHVPQNDLWTYSAYKAGSGPVNRIGINFGAAGDRRTEGGTTWLDYPNVSGPSPHLPVKLTAEKPQWFRLHSSKIEGDGMNWVAASGVRGIRSVTIPLGGEQSGSGERTYTVRLHFVEPKAATAAGENVFDVTVAGRVVISEFDIIKEVGGSRRPIVKQVTGVSVGRQLTITFTPKSGEPLVCGIEVVAESQ